MKGSISIATRRFVATRANYRCEYCHKPEIIANFSFHVEHIIGRQHGGSNQLANLAYACSHCNWKKGPNIATKLKESENLIPLFNPRKDNWEDHFYLNKGVILGKTEIGRGTLFLLEFNKDELVTERKMLIEVGLF